MHNQPPPPINKQLLAAVQSPTTAAIKQYIRKLIKQLKMQHEQPFPFLKQTMGSLAGLLKDPNIHPKIKLQSHRMIMFLILLADLDVYRELLETLYPILKTSCLYNKNGALETRGEGYFRQSKYFTQSSTTSAEKSELKKCGCYFIIFCLETVEQLARWLPYDLEDETQHTKFYIAYQNLVKEGVEFPRENHLVFYRSYIVEEIQRNIRDIERQYDSNIQSGATNSVGELKIASNEFNIAGMQSKRNRNSIQLRTQGTSQTPPPTQLTMDMQSKNKIFLLQDQKNKLHQQLKLQHEFFESELQKQKKTHDEKINRYEQKISQLYESVNTLKYKMSEIEKMDTHTPTHKQPNKSSSHSTATTDKMKDQLIADLQNTHTVLSQKVKHLQANLKATSPTQQHLGVTDQPPVNDVSLSTEIQKLKKENQSLKTKLLTSCAETTESCSNKHTKAECAKEHQSAPLRFVGSENARSCFEPFYSNSTSEIKTRLRKAILRDKQLLYRDKVIEVGCITKSENATTVRLVTVFTNISQKPMFNFAIDYISREDITTQLIQTNKNYLEIFGQTKSEIKITINQIDFRCLLGEVSFNVDGEIIKIALIMPISKFKLMEQMVFTPPKKLNKLKNIEKRIQYDKKMLPNIHKFKDYFEQALLQTDKNQHQMYNLKMLFMGTKFYIQCDQLESQLRLAVKFYEESEFPKAEKLLDQFVFLFIKN